jgi:hypothetical protein
MVESSAERWPFQVTRFAGRWAVAEETLSRGAAIVPDPLRAAPAAGRRDAPAGADVVAWSVNFSPPFEGGMVQIRTPVSSTA